MSKEKLLINNPKSNNSEVMSNKQIEEMTKDICGLDCSCEECLFTKYSKGSGKCGARKYAERAIVKGYRKQSEGEWIEQIKTTTNAKGMTAHYTINFCSNCGYEIGTIRYRHKYCPNCGAKMKGGAE